MKLHTLLLLIVLVAVTAFAAINWNTFITPTDLSVGITHIQMPLGLIMLGVLVFVSAIFLVFVVYLQTSALFEARRYSRELKSSRELADKAEASRFTELRAYLESALHEQALLHRQSAADIQARIDRLDGELRVFIEQSDNTLAAYIGELDDRLEKSGIQNNIP